MQRRLTHELSNGQSSVLSQPMGIMGGVGTGLYVVKGSSGGLVVGSSATGMGSSDDGPAIG